MPNLTPFQLDALDHSKHISLTANAGSGKTFVLAKRFLKILLEENILLSNVVAITFTEKAAAELYKKIALELDEKNNITTDESIRKKIKNIRRQLVSAKISTIHSFCADLLKEFSPEAGIDANFIPIDKNLSDELLTRSIEEMIGDLTKSESPLFEDLKKIIRLFGSRMIASKHIKHLVDNRSTLIRLYTTVYKKDKTEIVEHFNKIFVEYFNDIFNDQIELILKTIDQVNSTVLQSAKNPDRAEEVEGLLESKNDENLFQQIILLNEILNKIISGGKIRTRNYLGAAKREEHASEIELIEKFAEEFKPFIISPDYREAENQLINFSISIINLYDEALGRYEDKKNQFGYLDFEDLLLVTQDLLKRQDVITVLAERYKYFMIDEYQDTNETQYNIFIPILDYLKRGNLFIVGDEKQSIYMFRGADLEIFNKTKNVIKDSADSDSLLKLPHSFRLSPELTLFTNKVFSTLFHNPNFLYNEVEYDELVCARKSTKESRVEFLISERDVGGQSESELVAKRIIQLIREDKAQFKDIAILSRKRKSFPEIEKKLVEYEIPYLIFGGKGFYQRQEIYDVFNYLSFIVNPNNDAALIGILRSPFFSVSDLELFELSLEDGAYYFEKLKNLSKNSPKFQKILFQLEKHFHLSKTFQISILIRQILMDTGYWAILSSKKNSKQYISNIEKLIKTSNKFVSQGLKTLYDFVNYIEEFISSTEDESQASILSSDNAVKLMTIHGSKGLEFPSVFLIDTNTRGIDDRIKSKGVNIDKNFGLLTKTPIEGNYFNEYSSAPIVCMYNYVSQKKSIAELKRLLYVGVTRAQNSLYLSAEIKRNKAGQFKPERFSLLGLLMEGLKIDDFKNELLLFDNIKFMIEKDEGFLNIQKKMSLSIPTINSLDVPIDQMLETPKKSSKNIIIETNPITDQTKNEIISATKVAVFNQCPLKYYLIYELGYSALHSKMNKTFTMDYSREDTEEMSSNIKGSIVHKLLEEEIPLESLEDRIGELMKSFDEQSTASDKEGSYDSILSMIKKYYQSDIYTQLKKFKEYKNEFEIYAKVNDYFIYGILDKVIFDGNRVHIFDYKTDSLKKSTIKDKLENYKPQLIFYALLISKLYSNVKEISCNLIVLEEPSKIGTFSLSKTQLKIFEKDLHQIVLAIRSNEFKTNTSHCKSCYFSDSKNQCIV